jgi:uncharacterized membrane protein YhdT
MRIVSKWCLGVTLVFSWAGLEGIPKSFACLSLKLLILGLCIVTGV